MPREPSALLPHTPCPFWALGGCALSWGTWWGGEAVFIVGLPPCCTTAGGDISRLPAFESHRVSGLLFPFFSPSRDPSHVFSPPADCQIPARTGRTKSNPWWVPGRLIRWGLGGWWWQLKWWLISVIMLDTDCVMRH